MGGHAETVEFLLKRGANVHAGNDFCLRNAAKLKLYDIASILLAFGADAFSNNSESISVAVSEADDRLLSLLLKRVDLNNLVLRSLKIDQNLVALKDF